MKTAESSGGIILHAFENQLKIVLARDPDKGANAWVIPKGHIRSGESIEQTALREIREEVGLGNVILIKYLGKIVRESKEDWGELVQKTTYIFLGYALIDESKNVDLKPETEADWFTLSEAIKLIPFKEDCDFVTEQLGPLLAE